MRFLYIILSGHENPAYTVFYAILWTASVRITETRNDGVWGK